MWHLILVGIALLSGPCVVESEYILRRCVLKAWIPCASAGSGSFWEAGKRPHKWVNVIAPGQKEQVYSTLHVRLEHSCPGKIRYPICHPGNRLPDQGLARFPSIWNWEKEIPVLPGLHRLRCFATIAQTKARHFQVRLGYKSEDSLGKAAFPHSSVGPDGTTRPKEGNPFSSSLLPLLLLLSCLSP